MPLDDPADDRIARLLTEADNHRNAGNVESAYKALKAAADLDPTNKLVEAGLSAPQTRDIGDDAFVTLLIRYQNDADGATGKSALQALRTSSVRAADALLALDLLLNQNPPKLSSDALLGTLLNVSPDARKEVVSRLKSEVTMLFEKFYTIGRQSFRVFTGLPVDESAWSSGNDQAKSQRDIFQVCTAKLLGTNVQHSERVLEAMTRLLTLAPKNVSSLIDADVFEVVLARLDIRNEASLRSQAMLAIAKMFELTVEKGEVLFANFITSAVAKQTSEALVIAFSAASAIFPIVAPIATKLFLTEGFVQQLVTILERNSQATKQGHR
jgi:hypothetical protein